MKIRLFSDLHLEFREWEVPYLKDRQKEKNYVVLLAGDIAVARKHGTYVDFLTDLCNRHKAVIYVPGNHEYYGGSFDTAWHNMKEMVGPIPNLHMLQGGQFVDIDGVRFIGATLWTDFDNGNPLSVYYAGTAMSDYFAINRLKMNDEGTWDYYGKLKPEHTMAEHKRHVESIDDALYQGEGLVNVVVTHHAPTWRSVSPDFVGDKLNPAYVSDLTDLIRERAPAIWVHGHVHSSMNYTQDKTRVFANPKGYPNRSIMGPEHENEEFIESGVIEELNEVLAVQLQ